MNFGDFEGLEGRSRGRRRHHPRDARCRGQFHRHHPRVVGGKAVKGRREVVVHAT